MKRIFKYFKKEKSDSNLRKSLKERYRAFQELLSENNQVLSLMADMEEKHTGESFFNREYIKTNAGLISEKVFVIVRNLDILSSGKYESLYPVYENIRKQVESILSSGFSIPESDLTIPVQGLASSMSNIAGGKIAHLGEISNRLNMIIPDGFSITAHAFKIFFEHNRLRERITEKLSSVDIDNIEDLDRTSLEIQKYIIGSDLPAELENSIREAYSALCRRAGAEVRVSVRSSAVREDGESSFAGQYATFLNVAGDFVASKYKEVVASLFNPRAIFYYKTQGFSEDELVMAVGVLKMVDAMSAGVVYSRDPNEPGRNILIINAMWGLGKSVVDGTVEPDTFVLSRPAGDVIERKIASKSKMVVCDEGSDIKESPVSARLGSLQCISDEQIITLYNCAIALERYYGRPQDIEWAVGHDNRLYILQTRPLKVASSQVFFADVPKKIDGRNILIDKGVIACRGVGHGTAFVLQKMDDLKDFPEGAVLVAKHTNTRFVTVMNKAAAIITDIGGTTGHMASLSREYQVPTILDTETATETIRTGQEITVDAINCNIYEGKVEELLDYALQRKSSRKETPLHSTMERVIRFISPLSLIDPDHDNFTPEQCRTYHDITRFAHEMAMSEIFRTGKGFEIDGLVDFMSAIAFAEAGESKDIELQSIILRAGIPVEIRMIDVEGGVKGKIKKKAARPDDVLSLPFSSFLRGLTSMRWPGPKPEESRGFMGSAAQVSMTRDQLRKIEEKSYAIISRNHMNFSIRLGYHFSMVEAYTGENINDNYIKFFFKGGGAVHDRKMRRVRLIKEILESMNFKVHVIDDCVDAILTKYRQQHLEKVLEVMGRFTVFTKQLDMALFNDDVADMFIEDFIRDHVSLIRK